MQIKKNIGRGFLVLSLIVLFFWGVFSFIQLKSQEETYNIDIFSLIPKDSYGLMYFQSVDKGKMQDKNLSVFKSLLPEEKGFEIAKFIEGELIISYHTPLNTLLISKMKNDKFMGLHQHGFKHILSTSKPKTILFNKHKIYIQQSVDNLFFCYTFHQGVFLGSYSLKLLYNAIEMFYTKENLRDNIDFNKYAETLEKRAFASVFFIDNSSSNDSADYKFDKWISGDINIEAEGKTSISGMIINQESILNLKDILVTDGNYFNINDFPADTKSLLFMQKDSSSIDNYGFGACLTDTDYFNDLTSHEELVFFIKADSTNLDPFFDLELPSFDYIFNPIFNIDSQSYATCIYNGYILFCKSEEKLMKYVEQIKSEETLQQSTFFELMYPYKDKKQVFFFLSEGKYIDQMLSKMQYKAPIFFDSALKKLNQNKLLLQLNEYNGKIFFYVEVK
ncbi:hypothetical protein AwDysgo_05310 [Bacteroidales bacterium]|nr:hypothetical protein AwDysgo_05310 [Bacteroidales bacterium]